MLHFQTMTQSIMLCYVMYIGIYWLTHQACSDVVGANCRSGEPYKRPPRHPRSTSSTRIDIVSTGSINMGSTWGRHQIDAGSTSDRHRINIGSITDRHLIKNRSTSIRCRFRRSWSISGVKGVHKERTMLTGQVKSFCHSFFLTFKPQGFP